MQTITIINGSQRPKSQSAKVVDFIRMLLERRGGVKLNLLSLHETPLRLWSDDPEAQQEQAPRWAPIAEMIRASEALTFVVPEWNGMATPAIKNFFLYCTGQELADRPALIVAVSSGNGGSLPASELRATSFKDTQVCYIPEQVIVRRVNAVLNNAEQPESEEDAYVRYRLDYALGVLLEYGKALTLVRESGVRSFEILPYGM